MLASGHSKFKVNCFFAKKTKIKEEQIWTVTQALLILKRFVLSGRENTLLQSYYCKYFVLILMGRFIYCN
jgi:hypothetical protein